MTAPELSVVIAVFNERDTIEEVLRRVRDVPIAKQIIVVDDGSTDGTRELLQRLEGGGPGLVGWPERGDFVVILQDQNRGKGAAVRRGFAAATGEFVLIQDADLELDPADYPRLIEPLRQGIADVVYGSRFLGGARHVVFFWHYVANRLQTLVSNMLTNLNFSDLWTCYKVFRKSVLDTLDLKEDRFGFEPEVTAKLARGRWRIHEVPVSYWQRGYGEGKKIRWTDGLYGLWCILRYNLFK
ncbi:MAG: glycosyltransferase family 2 protein [Acidobacteria bacterium]|nr:glycosyltransferase family 2 protein [Acidobacteriota bacterium]